MLKVKKIKPMFNRILVTADRYDEVKVGNIIDSSKSNTIKEYQKVVAVGSTVRDIKEGDIVLINPTRYAIRKHQEGSMKDGIISDNPVTHFNFNIVELDDVPHILLFDSDIDYVLQDFTEEEDTSVVTPYKPTLTV